MRPSLARLCPAQEDALEVAVEMAGDDAAEIEAAAVKLDAVLRHLRHPALALL